MTMHRRRRRAHRLGLGWEVTSGGVVGVGAGFGFGCGPVGEGFPFAPDALVVGGGGGFAGAVAGTVGAGGAPGTQSLHDVVKWHCSHFVGNFWATWFGALL